MVTADRILAAILFRGALDREIDGMGVTDYLWGRKGIIPILEIEPGLVERADDVQVLREIAGLEKTLAGGQLTHRADPGPRRPVESPRRISGSADDPGPGR